MVKLLKTTNWKPHTLQIIYEDIEVFFDNTQINSRKNIQVRLIYFLYINNNLPHAFMILQVITL